MSEFLVKQRLLDWLNHQSDILDDTAERCIDIPTEIKFLYASAFLRGLAGDIKEGYFDWTGEGD